MTKNGHQTGGASEGADAATLSPSPSTQTQQTQPCGKNQQSYIATLNKAANPEIAKNISTNAITEALDNILSGSDVTAEKDALLNFAKSPCAKRGKNNELLRKALHDLGLIGDLAVVDYFVNLLNTPSIDVTVEEAVLKALQDIASVKIIEKAEGLTSTLMGIIEATPAPDSPPDSIKKAAKYTLITVLGENASYTADLERRQRWEINALGVYILFVSGFFALLGFWAYANPLHIDPFLKDFIYVACAGGLGGAITCGRAFYRYKGDNINKFSLDWSWWYIMSPFIGVVIGLVAYLLIVAGIVTFGSSSTGTLSYPLPLRSIALFCVASFLAGHYFPTFDNKLNDVFKSLFGIKSETALGGVEK